MVGRPQRCLAQTSRMERKKMGREVKRVAAGFDWPIETTWPGYLNTLAEGHCRDCEDCGGTGNSPEVRRLHDMWYGNAPFEPSMTGSTPFTGDEEPIRNLATRNVERDFDFYLRAAWGPEGGILLRLTDPSVR